MKYYICTKCLGYSSVDDSTAIIDFCYECVSTFYVIEISKKQYEIIKLLYDK